MEVENFVENKKIINWKFIALYNVLIGVLAVLSAYVVFQKYDKVGEYISNIKINNIIDIVTTFGMVAISIFPILIEKIDTRIVGISYKVIFFKNIRWKYMNYSNVTFILLETMVISIILECFPKNSLLRDDNNSLANNCNSR